MFFDRKKGSEKLRQKILGRGIQIDPTLCFVLDLYFLRGEKWRKMGERVKD